MMMRKPQFSEEDPFSQVESSISLDVRCYQREFPSTWKRNGLDFKVDRNE